MAEIANWGLGEANPFLGKDNPYLQSIIDLSSRDLVDNYNRKVLPASNAAMIKSGSFGNSGLQELERADAEGLQRNLGDLASKLRFNDYGQQQQMFQWDQGQQEGIRRFDLGFDRDVFNDAYAQNMGNLQAGIGLLGTMGGYTQGDITNTTNQQNTPLNYWSQFQNAANGLARGFGTQTTTQGTTSNPLATAAGGAQLGNSWWNRGGSGGNAPPSGYSNWDSYNYGNNGGGDSLGSAGTAAGWW